MNRLLLIVSLVSASLICKAQLFTSITSGSTITTDVGESRGIAWVDYDGDGDLDLYTSNETSNNFLYRNDGGNTFTRILTGPLVNDGSLSTSSTWADYDNDGDLDVFLCVGGSSNNNNKLYRNDGGGTFTEIITGDIVSDGGATNSASWADYDNDGYVDLIVSNGGSENNFLYHNNGTGTFTRILTGPVVTDGGTSWAPVWGDYDNDGYLDLFIANNGNEANFLYHNNSGNSFTRITIGDIVTDTGLSWGSAFGDYDNDGDLDLYVTNYGGQANNLYQNNGNGSFTKILTGAIVSTTRYSTDCQWVDVNNDGYLDLASANAHFQGGTNSENIIYINNGNGTFTEVTSGEAFVDNDFSSGGLAAGDYDNDGFIDLSTACNQSDLSSLFKNNGNGNNWVNLLLEGMVSNRSAVGATVQLKAHINSADIWQYREVQTTTSARSQESLNVEFGLGDATIIDSIIVTWPSGIVCYYTNVPTNAFYDVLETCVPINCTSPLSGFTFTDTLLTATFTDTSIVTGTSTYFWDFGDGNFSSLQDPTHIYLSTGTYTVCLTVTDSCGTDSTCTSITVDNCVNPTANFTSTDNGNGNVSFLDASTATAGSTFWWDFGDGNFSALQDPTNNYLANGTYTVCLTITDSCGTDSTCQDITISGLSINEHYNNQNVTVFPNPFSDHTVIQLENGKGNYSVELFDITGRMVTSENYKNTNSLTINRNNLDAGTYLYRIVQNNSTIASGKLMIVN
jgi:PKD repeat protein